MQGRLRTRGWRRLLRLAGRKRSISWDPSPSTNGQRCKVPANATRRYKMRSLDDAFCGACRADRATPALGRLRTEHARPASLISIVLLGLVAKLSDDPFWLSAALLGVAAGSSTKMVGKGCRHARCAQVTCSSLGKCGRAVTRL